MESHTAQDGSPDPNCPDDGLNASVNVTDPDMVRLRKTATVAAPTPSFWVTIVCLSFVVASLAILANASRVELALAAWLNDEPPQTATVDDFEICGTSQLMHEQEREQQRRKWQFWKDRE